MGAIHIVLSTEVLTQKALLGGDAGNEDGNCEPCEQYSHTGSESERPSEHVHYQAEIAWVANSAVNPTRDKRVVLLNGHKPAEARAQHEYRP